MISAGDFRNGITIEYEGNIYQIMGGRTANGNASNNTVMAGKGNGVFRSAAPAGESVYPPACLEQGLRAAQADAAAAA